MHTTRATLGDGRQVLAIHNSDYSGMAEIRTFGIDGNLSGHAMIRGDELRAIARAIARKEVLQDAIALLESKMPPLREG